MDNGSDYIVLLPLVYWAFIIDVSQAARNLRIFSWRLGASEGQIRVSISITFFQLKKLTSVKRKLVIGRKYLRDSRKYSHRIEEFSSDDSDR